MVENGQKKDLVWFGLVLGGQVGMAFFILGLFLNQVLTGLF